MITVQSTRLTNSLTLLEFSERRGKQKWTKEVLSGNREKDETLGVYIKQCKGRLLLEFSVLVPLFYFFFSKKKILV